MNIQDLEKFLVIAEVENLQVAADKLDSSPSALSKSLKRLENSLNSPLFDRVGKNIQINPAGELLRIKAAQMVAHAKQTKAEFAGLATTGQYRIVGPSILQFKWATVISKGIMATYPNARLAFDSMFEQEALDKVVNGNAELGLVTTAIASKIPDDLHRIALGTVTMQVAASRTHSLIKDRNTNKVTVSLKELLPHAFATPSVSPYCGEPRGIGCDGWQNQVYPRKLQIVVNDYSILTKLVRAGLVLAYLPDYWLREWDLINIEVSDCPYHCVENLLLVSWQKELLTLIE
ncbi:LysR family transcriptional regulator [Aliikangiella marina]|uniref:LysR family transcriptional regulator n=1 Tax=Aliikangiella marina TaxID=1712262 RepID=A0A545TE38_9GAMM|nr:LysR family transcriptional regulator [Aliikangiella marina]TQV75485.1 LysR family transcriptional regulator [Aliikangiella marina]